MAFDRTSPHNSLPPLPPSAVLETWDVLKQTIASARALAVYYINNAMALSLKR